MDATQMILGPHNKDINLKDYIMMSDDEEPGISFHNKSIEYVIEENPLGAQGLNPIDKLNDDCLRLIFQYLPIFEKVRVEAVCKKWQVLSKESWYSFKRLDLSPLTWGWTEKSKIKCIDNKIFEKVLLRCGQYLKAVDLSMRNYPSHKVGLFQNLNLETIALICHSCPNMQALNLTDLEMDQMRNNRNSNRKRRYMFLQACEHRRRCEHVNARECERAFCLCELADVRDHEYIVDSAILSQEEVHDMMDSLISCCPNLIKLGMGMRSLGYSLEDLSELFQKMKKVKHLRLTTIPGTCLRHLSFETIEELFLGAFNGIYPDHLSNVIEKFKMLKTLVLDTCRYIDDQGMRKLLSQAGTLKNLGLIGGSHSLSVQAMKHIPRFSNLEKLNVKGNNLVDDELLEALAVNCEQLIYLNVSCCEKVTNNGVLSISTLPHLEHLIISHLTHVSDRFLGRIHNLKVLDCQYCPRMSDEGLCILLERSPDLRILILEGCRLVTEKLLDVAVEATETRSNNIVLTISINNNASCDVAKFNLASPLLRVVNKIARQDSCRMDFKDEYFPVEEDNFVTCEFSTLEKFVFL